MLTFGDPMPLAEALVRGHEAIGMLPASHRAALCTLLAYAEAWAWCDANACEVNFDHMGTVVVQLVDAAGQGPDLPAAVAEARSKLEASR